MVFPKSLGQFTRPGYSLSEGQVQAEDDLGNLRALGVPGGIVHAIEERLDLPSGPLHVVAVVLDDLGDQPAKLTGMGGRW